jgi:hypothetical protein
MSLLTIISNTLIDRVMFSITSSITKVLIGTNITIVIRRMALDTIRNSISNTNNRVIYVVFRDIEHIITSSTHESSVSIKISRVISNTVRCGIKTFLRSRMIIIRWLTFITAVIINRVY